MLLTGVAAAIALAAVISCTFLGDLAEPFEYTTVAFQGVVYDSGFNIPLWGANVILASGEQRTATDSSGRFTIAETRTGLHPLIVSKAGYETLSRMIDLTLNPRPDTIRLQRVNAAPVITGFVVDTGALRCIDDTVTFIYSARDSSGGIAASVLDPGKGTPRLRSWSGYPGRISDTLRIVYDSSDTFKAQLTIIGRNNDTIRQSMTLAIPANRRPVFTLLRPSSGGFINGTWGFLEIYSHDPDGNFSSLTIGWGDTAKTEKSTDSAGAHWHKYAFTSDTTVLVTITLFDSSGAKNYSTFAMNVRNTSAPKLDDRIVFSPSQYLIPDDTAVIIGVRVLDIDSGYVAEIIWMINQDDPLTVQSVRKNYTPQTGVIGPVGNVFANSFGTTRFKGTNFVQILVRDRLGKTSQVIGSFSVAGKPN
jgi:hypothetical protein